MELEQFKKGLAEIIDYLNADIIGFQETKAQDDQVREALHEVQGYHIYSSSAIKKDTVEPQYLAKKNPLTSPMVLELMSTTRKEG